MTGGKLRTWWRVHSLDRIEWPASPASVDVSAAKAQWDKLTSTLTSVPRAFKKGEKVDLGNGKMGIRSSRGTLPARNHDKDDKKDVEEDDEQDDEQDEGEVAETPGGDLTETDELEKYTKVINLASATKIAK